MPFNPQTAREAGRKSSRKGKPNKANRKTKEFYTALLEDEQVKFVRELKKLKGKDYVYAYLKITEFVVPKEKHVNQRIDLSNMTEERAAAIINELINNENPHAEEILKQLDDNRQEFNITFNID